MKAFKIFREYFLIVLIMFLSVYQTFGQLPPSAKKVKSGDYTYFKGGALSVVPSSHQDIAWDGQYR